MGARDEFPKPVRERLAKRVAYRCSNPHCRRATLGPHVDANKSVSIGVAAHITAAAKGGPRFDATLTSEDRRSISNAIWLCHGCSRLIDPSEAEAIYPASLLRQWKSHAEAYARDELPGSHPIANPIANLERIVRGHSSFVWDVAVTPDSRRVLSASNDKTVAISDLATGNRLLTLSGHTAFVCSLAISSDGSMVAAGAYDGVVKVWELASGAEIATFKQQAGDAKVGFTCQDQTLVSGAADGTLTVWDFPLGTSARILRLHDAAILKAICLRDDVRVLTVSADKSIRISDLTDGSCTSTFRGHSGEVNSAAVSRDQRILVSGSEDRSVRVWNIETGEPIADLVRHTTVVWRVAISPDGNIVASGSGDNTVLLWNLKSFALVQSLPHPDCVAAVAFSPDGTKLVVGCDDHQVYIYKLDM
jgi:WD40 repeat protein